MKITDETLLVSGFPGLSLARVLAGQMLAEAGWGQNWSCQFLAVPSLHSHHWNCAATRRSASSGRPESSLPHNPSYPHLSPPSLALISSPHYDHILILLMMYYANKERFLLYIRVLIILHNCSGAECLFVDIILSILPLSDTASPVCPRSLYNYNIWAQVPG